DLLSFEHADGIQNAVVKQIYVDLQREWYDMGIECSMINVNKDSLLFLFPVKQLRLLTQDAHLVTGQRNSATQQKI
ncbi:hypothetical protein AaE_002663, partial [Aphanomyces astaci]